MKFLLCQLSSVSSHSLHDWPCLCRTILSSLLWSLKWHQILNPLKILRFQRQRILLRQREFFQEVFLMKKYHRWKWHTGFLRLEDRSAWFLWQSKNSSLLFHSKGFIYLKLLEVFLSLHTPWLFLGFLSIWLCLCLWMLPCSWDTEDCLMSISSHIQSS